MKEKLNNEEEYISFELAELLNKLGYNEKCKYEYDINKKIVESHFSYATNFNLDSNCLCTTISYGRLDKWLRDKYKMFFYIKPLYTFSHLFTCGYIYCNGKKYNSYCSKSDVEYDELRDYMFKKILLLLIEEKINLKIK